MICENCGKEYDGSYGSGRFCSKSCSISYGNKNRIKSIETKQKISNSVKEYFKNNPKSQIHVYTCDKCGIEFESNITLRKDRKIHCENCKQHRVHYKNIQNINSLLDISKRTITKILKRSNAKCVICGWDESTCDIHHIIPKSQGGSNTSDNLIIVCPNCHRVIHANKKYDIEYLQSLSIDKTFVNWKDFYHTKN